MLRHTEEATAAVPGREEDLQLEHSAFRAAPHTAAEKERTGDGT